MIGLDAPIVIRRARFQDEKTGKIICPLDELLDLPAGEVTVSLARRTLSLSTKMSFGELQEELVEQHDVRLTDSMLDDLMRKVGGVAEADQQARIDALAAADRGIARERQVTVERVAPPRLYVSCDGITYRTRYREPDPDRPGQKRVVYQEMKCGAVYWQDAKERWHKQVVVGRDDPERFGLALWRTAVACGMLACPEVIFISDGGAWCNTVAELYFREAVRILDWYHLSEHVWAAGRELYPLKEKGLGRWVACCLDRLHDGGGVELLEHLERCRRFRDEAGKRAIDDLVKYVRPRAAITDYPRYREQGYVIGSGMIESSCKQLVGQRLKGPGMQWSEAGALAMSHLVGQRLNRTWNEFWAGRPLQRAA